MDATKRPLRIPPEFGVYAEEHGIFDLYKVNYLRYRRVRCYLRYNNASRAMGRVSSCSPRNINKVGIIHNSNVVCNQSNRSRVILLIKNTLPV